MISIEKVRSIQQIVRSIARAHGLVAISDTPTYTKRGVTFTVGLQPAARSWEMRREGGWNKVYEDAGQATTLEIVTKLSSTGFTATAEPWRDGNKFKFRVLA